MHGLIFETKPGWYKSASKNRTTSSQVDEVAPSEVTSMQNTEEQPIRQGKDGWVDKQESLTHWRPKSQSSNAVKEQRIPEMTARNYENNNWSIKGRNSYSDSDWLSLLSKR